MIKFSLITQRLENLMHKRVRQRLAFQLDLPEVLVKIFGVTGEDGGEEGGEGLLLVGGVIAVILLFLFIITRILLF